ncbi:hypothetical protein KP509_1Z239000 [Ceratopteris richardii]|nr:hypothetical protein KP509_1Z239000 [Ceratopteris richardii]
MDDAWDSFSKVHEKDIISWNAMIAACVQNGDFQEGFQLFRRAFLEGFLPNKATILTFLDICSEYAWVHVGKEIHCSLFFWESMYETAVENAVMNMYSRCGNVENMRKMFDNMMERDVVSWTCMITSLVQHNLITDALQYFQQMLLECVFPNQVTFINVLSACATMMAVRDGVRIHALVVGCGIEVHNLIGNALTNMYGKFSHLVMAHSIFANFLDRDLVSWNTIIGISDESSMVFFEQMLVEGFIPNRATFLAVLTSCTVEIPSFVIVKYLHSHCIAIGLASDIVMVTALVNVYGKCGYIGGAWMLFNSVSEPDLILYNAMISALAQTEHADDGFKLLQVLQMKSILPDKGTFVSILDSCSGHESVSKGRQVHVLIGGVEELQPDAMMGNALLSMYGKCGKLEDVLEVFGTFGTLDTTSWNAMINALGQCGDINSAVRQFEAMQTEGVMPDKFTFAGLLYAYGSKQALREGIFLHARIVVSAFHNEIIVLNALISLYGKCGDIEGARNSFNRIAKPDSVSLNALIGACLRCGQCGEALLLYQSMHNINYDKVTLISASSAFASQSVLADAWLLHGCIIDMGLHSDLSVCNALVHMYGKCGSLEDSRHVFERMEANDIISWNAVIAAYGQHGRADIAFHLVCRMISKGLVPDKVTLVSLLTACSHSGLVEEGYHIFTSMIDGYCIVSTIDHYNCMIDLLGRAGQLYEAETMMKAMPMDTNASSWMTMLGSCNKHLDLERGELAAMMLMNLDPQESASFVVLSNLYTSLGLGDDSEEKIQILATA